MKNKENTDYERKEETTPAFRKVVYAHPEDEAKACRKESRENIRWQETLTSNGYPIGYF